jgi:uncharacterized membrane protein
MATGHGGGYYQQKEGFNVLPLRLGYGLWTVCLLLLVWSTARTHYLHMVSYVALMAICGYCIGRWKEQLRRGD